MYQCFPEMKLEWRCFESVCNTKGSDVNICRTALTFISARLSFVRSPCYRSLERVGFSAVEISLNLIVLRVIIMTIFLVTTYYDIALDFQSSTPKAEACPAKPPLLTRDV